VASGGSQKPQTPNLKSAATLFGTVRFANGAALDIADFISMPLPKFLRATGLSRERFYKLDAADEIESFLLGARRFVVVESYRRLIARQQASAQAGAPPPRRRREGETRAEPPAPTPFDTAAHPPGCRR
jgi:hypothetical protein